MAEDNDMSMHLQRMMAETEQPAMMAAKPVFEVNPEHKLVKQLKDQQDDKMFSEWTYLLFDQFISRSRPVRRPCSFC